MPGAPTERLAKVELFRHFDDRQLRQIAEAINEYNLTGSVIKWGGVTR